MAGTKHIGDVDLPTEGPGYAYGLFLALAFLVLIATVIGLRFAATPHGI